MAREDLSGEAEPGAEMQVGEEEDEAQMEDAFQNVAQGIALVREDLRLQELDSRLNELEPMIDRAALTGREERMRALRLMMQTRVRLLEERMAEARRRLLRGAGAGAEEMEASPGKPLDKPEQPEAAFAPGTSSASTSTTNTSSTSTSAYDAAVAAAAAVFALFDKDQAACEEEQQKRMDQREKRRMEDRVALVRTRRAKARGNPFKRGDNLCRAILDGRPEEIRELVEKGANVNYVDTKGDRPLMNAVVHPDPNEELVELLLKKGAHVNAIDTNGKTALHRCIFGPRTCWALRSLLRAGAVVDARDLHGETPLHWAAHQENEEAIRVLLDAGAKRNLRYWGGFWAGQTPYDVARPGPLRELLRPLPRPTFCPDLL